MVRNKVAAAMAGAALLVAAYGGVAGAEDDGARDTSTDRINASIVCNGDFGWSHVDANGDGVYETHFAIPCYGNVGTYHL